VCLYGVLRGIGDVLLKPASPGLGLYDMMGDLALVAEGKGGCHENLIGLGDSLHVFKHELQLPRVCMGDSAIS
jgi:hypothetical protein